MLRFDSITPDMVLAGIKALPGLLRQIAGNAGLARNLPVLGTNAQNLITLADKMDQLLGPTGLGAFDTAQKLQQALQNQLNMLLHGSDVHVSVAGDVRFVLHLLQTFSNSALGFNVNAKLPGADIGIQLAAQAAVIGSVDVTLGIGVSFDANLSAADRFYVLTGTPS